MTKLALTAILLPAVVFANAQTHPADDFFQPYKYPKHYTYDGAYGLVEFNALLPQGTSGWGGMFITDFASTKLGTASLRLNFGIGLGYQAKKMVTTEFAATELFGSGTGENYITDRNRYLTLRLYPRLWIRVLDPINISIAGGATAYNLSRSTDAYFTMNHGFFDEENYALEYGAKDHKMGLTWFYEAKAMFNFKNWGLSAGITKLGIDGYDMQPVVGMWFGQSAFIPVRN